MQPGEGECFLQETEEPLEPLASVAVHQHAAMFDTLNLFRTTNIITSYDVHARLDQKRAAATEAEAYRAIELAAKQLEQRPSSLELHAKHLQSLLDLLALQLRRSESAVVRACPDSSACDAVKLTRARLERGLQAALQLVGWKGAAAKGDAAGGDASITLQALLDIPSILGAMQFCRFFTTKAGVALLHNTLVAEREQRHQHQQLRDQQLQQPAQRPFTLVVDAHGTGHVATLQAALDMAATAAAQDANQFFDSSCACSLTLCAEQCNHAAVGNSAAQHHAGGSCNCTTSARASEHVLLVLLPGTYKCTCTLPGAIKHVTIAGMPGYTTVLAETGGELASDTPQQNQSLNAHMAQLQLSQQRVVKRPSTDPPQRLSAICKPLPPQSQLPVGSPLCLLTCPFGVESVKLQHLQFHLTGQAGTACPAPQFLTALPCQDSVPAASSTSGESSRRAKGSSSNNNSISSGTVVSGHDGTAPYCIRLSAGCELRLEWCDFSGGAGGVLSEAGANVTAMQCSFHL